MSARRGACAPGRISQNAQMSPSLVKRAAEPVSRMGMATETIKRASDVERHLIARAGSLTTCRLQYNY